MGENKFYDYQNIVVDENKVSQTLDGYECFGWEEDSNLSREKSMGNVTLHFKRDRRIMNKTELTRLQRHYESCTHEINVLEKSPQNRATIVSLSCGLTGCGFMAGSVFAVTAQPPIIWLCILLSVPGVVFWFAAWLGYRLMKNKRAAQVAPLIEKKYDEALEVCNRARELL